MTYAPYRVTLEFKIKNNQLQYTLGDAQQLNKPSVRLNQIIAYFDTELTESITGQPLCSLKTILTGYLFLQDPSSTQIRQGESLGLYLPDGKFKEVIRFNYQEVDFTKSYFKYPSNTQPAADDGKSLQLDIEYLDVSVPLMAPIYPLAEAQ